LSKRMRAKILVFRFLETFAPEILVQIFAN